MTAAVRTLSRRRVWLWLTIIAIFAVVPSILWQARARAVAICGSGTATNATTCTYTATGEGTFNVPAGVSSITVTAIGGKGGRGYVIGSGGFGGRVVAEVAVTQGTAVYVEVAGNGSDGAGGTVAAAGGFNGGGDSGGGGLAAAVNGIGGGGGGASDVRTVARANAGSLASRLLVAGGGGGTGGQAGSIGGDGGSSGATANPGAAGLPFGAGGGGGATTSAGGGAGPNTECCGQGGSGVAGALGTGGAGGFRTGTAGAGGGGGGGFYGGGGGAGICCNGGGAGGGGGSSHVPTAIGTPTITTDTTGTPSIVITWVAKTNQTINFAALDNKFTTDAPFNVSATASSGLAVTFATTTAPVCTSGGTNGATITIVAIGTCTVTADQAGNATYNPAPSVGHSFTVYAPETCDGVDNDGDGDIDEGFLNTDGDSQANCVDSDDDNDGVSDVDEIAVGSDPLDAASVPELCDGVDNDHDGLTDEGFDNTDGDSQANCVDTDDDNDGATDAAEATAGSDPLDATSMPGICDHHWTGTRTCTYNVTGEDVFVVPPGVDTVHVVAVGGRGGGSYAFSSLPGYGARVETDMQSDFFDQVFVEVGGNGGTGINVAGTTGVAGGFNGGGTSGSGGNPTATYGLGGGGGGASDVRLIARGAGVPSTTSKLLVAGGGGGQGGTSGGIGGAGGASGAPGATGGPYGAGGGTAGTQIAGGSGGPNPFGLGQGGSGSAGALETGGAGGFRTDFAGSGGGGGGGYYGGGGGSGMCCNGGGGGGGGGSSMVEDWFPGDPSITTDTTGIPSITITWEVGGGGGDDGDAPVITADANGYVQGEWTNQTVTVDFTCSDNDGDIVTDTVAGDSISSETSDGSITNTGECTDAAGHTADPATFEHIYIDKTTPVITADSHGYVADTWTNSSVTVDFSCDDDFGSIEVDTVAGDTVSADTDNGSVTNTGECTDYAGNSADPVSFEPIKVDTTKPVITTVATTEHGGWYLLGTTVYEPVVVSFDCADPGAHASGIASDTVGGDTTVYGPTTDGAVFSTGACTDNAGNSANGIAFSPIRIASSVSPQAITFTSDAPTDAVVDGETYTVEATGGASGNPVTFTIDAVADDVCSIAGDEVSFTGVGTCVIDADQAGTASYDAAPQEQQSFDVDKGAQAINFTSTAPDDAVVDGSTYTVEATGGASGNTVTFTIDATATSVCSIAGDVVSFNGVGSCVIDADQAGSAAYTAAPQEQQSFDVGKGDQIVTFLSTEPDDAVVDGDTYTVTAASTSGLTVTITVDASASDVCELTGATVSFIGAGTCVLDGDQAGDDDYNAADQAQQSFDVGQGAQAINFTSTAPAAIVGGSTYNATATGGASGNAVTFTIDATASSVCSITGSTVSFTGVGSCVIDADQAGTTDYSAAPQEQQTFGVGKGSQTVGITSTAPAAAVVSGATYSPTATSSAGLPVTITVDASASSVCSIVGSTVSFIGAGTCVLDANQAGNANYNAASQAQQSFSVGKGSQTVAFTSTAPGAAVVGGAIYTPTATSSRALAVTITVDATSSSVCSMTGSTVSFIGAGTCRLDANQAGNSNYNAAPQVQQIFTVGKGSQTVAFLSTAPTTASVGGPTYTVTAAATSGLAVTITVDATATSVCSISGSTVSFIGVGTCRLDANQAGNANYNAASQAQQSFSVSKATQTITFATLADRTLSASPFTVSATASSGLPVSFSSTTGPVCKTGGSNGTTVTLLAVGTCTIKADQAGNTTYNAAPSVSRSFGVTKTSQTISFASLAARTMLQSPFNVSATATSGLTVTFSIDPTTTSVCSSSGSNGIKITLLSSGSCIVVANQVGNATYAAAPSVPQSFVVSQVAQTITFGSLSNRRITQPALKVSATASSGLAVTFTIDPATATVCTATGKNGATITPTGLGLCTVIANQAGNATYSAALPRPQSFTFTP